jgi:asparagine synthase (glutamine-hydrolysing)
MGRVAEPNAICGAWISGGTNDRTEPLEGPLAGMCLQSIETRSAVLQHANWGEFAQSGGIRLVCDARIDHRDELIEAAGLTTSVTASAAQLLLESWIKLGPEMFDRLEGEFAIAVWHSAASTLVLARDAIGRRPLHYRETGGGIAFSSTALSLAALSGPVRPEIDRMGTLLSFVVDPGPSTFFRSVARILPGHWMSFQLGRPVRQERWWHPKTHPVPMAYEEAVARMRGEVERAVSAAIETSAPVIAAQLSGGHDSSLVVATAAGLTERTKPLIAITGDGRGAKAQLPPGAFDDAQIAAETAAMLKVEHRFALAEAESPLVATDRWFAEGEPMLNPFNLGWLDETYRLAREAGAEVMLVGAAGNLTVSHWGADLFPSLARSGRLLRLVQEWKAYRNAFRPSWPGMLAISFGPWIPRRLWDLLSRSRGKEVESFSERAFLRDEAPSARRARKIARAQGMATSNAPGRLLGAKMRLLELMWADPGPMSHWIRARHGIEIRDPLAARRVVELSLQLSADHFYRQGQGRRLSRALLQGRVPDRVTSEQAKGMQGLNWIEGAQLAQGELRAEVDLMENDRELATLFDVGQLRAMLDDWPAHWSDPDQTEVYRGFLTSSICAARWARRAREYQA